MKEVCLGGVIYIPEVSPYKVGMEAFAHNVSRYGRSHWTTGVYYVKGCPLELWDVVSPNHSYYNTGIWGIKHG